MQFGSDNQVGASSTVLEALVAANDGRSHGYGSDAWTKSATASLCKTFECELDALFVLTGTAANSLALASLVQPWEVILCHNHAHILNDESTAPEFFSSGARMVGISALDGKLEPKHLTEYFRSAGKEYPHNSRAAALSITQMSETGRVYTPQEIRTLSDEAHRNGLKVQMDGARFANAVASLGCSPADVSWKAGVDVLCLGATKNGALAAEAILCFDKSIAEQLIHRRKRSGHLLSKSRFVGAQMSAWLKDDHWLDLARRANQKAKALRDALGAVPGVRVVWPVEGNEIFAVMPKAMAARLRAAGAEFYDWPPSGLPEHEHLSEAESFVRLVASFTSEDREIAEFCAVARRI